MCEVSSNAKGKDLTRFIVLIPSIYFSGSWQVVITCLVLSCQTGSAVTTGQTAAGIQHSHQVACLDVTGDFNISCQITIGSYSVRDWRTFALQWPWWSCVYCLHYFCSWLGAIPPRVHNKIQALLLPQENNLLWIRAICPSPGAVYACQGRTEFYSRFVLILEKEKFFSKHFTHISEQIVWHAHILQGNFHCFVICVLKCKYNYGPITCKWLNE